MTIPYVTSQELQPMSEPYFNVTFCGKYCGEFGWLAHKPILKKSYGAALLFVQYGLPVILMSFCYFKILLKVKSDLVIGAHAGRPLQEQAAARKRSVMRVLVLMVLAFVGSWFPLAVFNILRDFEVEIDEFIDNQFYLVQLLSHAIAMTSVIWNPILYFWMSNTHRTALIQKLTSVSGNPMARMNVLLRRSNYATGSASLADCTLALTENPKNSVIRLSPHSSPSRVPRYVGSEEHVITSSAGSTKCPHIRRCSFDPFMDVNFDDVGELEKRNMSTTSKVKVHKIKGKSILSTRFPDIVTCAEDETQY